MQDSLPSSTALSSHNDSTDFTARLNLAVQSFRDDSVCRAKEAITKVILEEINKHEERISDLWNGILREMETFERNRNLVFDEFKKSEGDERVQLAIDSGRLYQIRPKSLTAIARHFAEDNQQASGPASPMGLLLPAVQDSSAPLPPTTSASASPKDSLPSPPASTTPSHGRPPTPTAPKQFMAKRSRVQTSLPLDLIGPPSAKKQRSDDGRWEPAKPPMKNKVMSYEVEAKEYIFPYPAVGTDFYIIRCGRGQPGHTPAHVFKTNPFDYKALALSHFNNTSKRCHNAHEKLSADDIVRRYGYKVDGAEVNKAWVEKSNRELEASLKTPSRESPAKKGTIHVDIGGGSALMT